MNQLPASLICLMMFIGLTGPAVAAPELQPGDEFPRLTLDDQHGNTIKTNADTRLVLFTSDMEGGKVVRQLLDDRTDAAQILDRAGAIYISDVSAMPAMIRRMMAVPAMRKRPYPILLDSKGEKTASLPRRASAVTLLQLDHSSITAVDFPGEAAQLAKIFGVRYSPDSD